jgi:hypothetical protein
MTKARSEEVPNKMLTQVYTVLPHPKSRNPQTFKLVHRISYQ